MDTMRITTHLGGTAVLIIMGIFGIKILTTGFILHLILRAYWLGMVCINYVYPNGIKGERIKQQKPFKIRNPMGDLREQIMRVDKLCGTVMFMSIASAIAIVSLTVTLLLLIFFIIGAESAGANAIVEYFAIFLMSAFAFYVFDLLLMGLFRKIPYISYLFFPFFKLFDLISFRKLYQRPLFLFSSNIKRINFFASAILFATFSICSTYLTVYRTMHWPNLFDSREFRWNMAAEDQYIHYGMYRDQMTTEERSKINIQSKLISSNYLDVFVLYERRYDRLIHKIEVENQANYFSNLIAIEVDDSAYTKINWYQKWSRDITNIGVSAMINISHLVNGPHTLKVYTKFELDKTEDPYHQGYVESIIPFWKDVN